MSSLPTPLRLLIASPWLGAVLACGSGGSGVGDPSAPGIAATSPGPDGDGTGTAPLAPPKFEFSPGPPGRAVGVRAIVEVDGVELTSEPIEILLAELPAEDGATGSVPLDSPFGAASAPDVRSQRDVLDKAAGPSLCPMPGATVSEMGTINGQICYFSTSLSGSVLGAQRGIIAVTFFAREGVYQMWQASDGLAVPVSFVAYGTGGSFGCIAANAPGSLSADYFGKLETLTFMVGTPVLVIGASLQVGWSVLIYPTRGVQRAFQADAGLEVSLGSLGLPLGGTYLTTETLAGPRFLMPWGSSCGAEVTDQNALEYVRAQMQGMETSPGSGLSGALGEEIRNGFMPLVDHVGSPGEGGLAANVSAGSNADYYAELLSFRDTELRPGATNTSADATLARAAERIAAAGDDGPAILSAGSQTLRDLHRTMPSQFQQAALQREAATAAQAADQLGRLLSPAVTAGTSYISQEIKRIRIQSGEQARVQLAAQDLADLVGRPVEDVNGATVVVNAGGAIQDAAFVLTGAGLALEVDVDAEGLLVRFDVDLSTADGVFPDDVGEWVVRPPLYLIEVEAGPAAGVLLSGPEQVASGGPASLTAQVFDASGRRVKRPISVRFVDDTGAEIGIMNAETGTAMLQHVPTPSAPSISGVTLTSITQSGSDSPGLAIAGTGFSADAALFLDGTRLESGTAYQVVQPERLLLRFPDDLSNGTHSVRIENPAGLASDEVDFTIPAP